MVSDTVLTFAAQQPIAAGDQIAFESTFGNPAVRTADKAGVTWLLWEDPSLAVGATKLPEPDSPPASEVLVNADVEPDADGDGFGDETQDGCPTDASIQGACPSPVAVPSNEFVLGKLKRNKKKGTAFVDAFFHGPGVVGLTGKGLQELPLVDAAARKSIAVQGGSVRLPVKPAKKGKRARKIRERLRNTGKAGVKFSVTFIPTGGVTNTRTRKLKLVLK
jgi:hypothetical protein